MELFGKIAATGPVRAASSSTLQTALTIDLQAIQRARHPDTHGIDFVSAYVDSTVAARLLKLSKEIRPTPEQMNGLDEVARDVIATDTSEIADISAHQNEQVELAERYGARLSRALFSLSLLALAAILLGLAAVLHIEHGGPIILGLAGLTLLLAGGWGASALLI